MKFVKERPTKEGFYWALNSEEKLTIVEVVDTNKISMGTTVRVNLLGHSYSYSLNNPLISRFSFGERIKVPREISKGNV